APLSNVVGVLNAVLQTFVATVEARVEQLGHAA
ncbi:MAG: 50S ribosomal protein L10, partial [Proteobacteria bacterium]|nr:50S ribosomal protein L10 [Pseudomonadota bacterium]